MPEVQAFLKSSWNELESRRIAQEQLEAERKRIQEVAEAEQKRAQESVETERKRARKAAEDAERRNQARIKRFNTANTIGLVALGTGVVGICSPGLLIVSFIASIITICQVIDNWRQGSSRLQLNVGHIAALCLPIPIVVGLIIFGIMLMGQLQQKSYNHQNPPPPTAEQLAHDDNIRQQHPPASSVVVRVSSERPSKVDWPPNMSWQSFRSPRSARLLYWRQNAMPQPSQRPDGILERYGIDDPLIPASRSSLWFQAETDDPKHVVQFDLVVDFSPH